MKQMFTEEEVVGKTVRAIGELLGREGFRIICFADESYILYKTDFVPDGDYHSIFIMPHFVKLCDSDLVKYGFKTQKEIDEEIIKEKELEKEKEQAILLKLMDKYPETARSRMRERMEESSWTMEDN